MSRYAGSRRSAGARHGPGFPRPARHHRSHGHDDHRASQTSEPASPPRQSALPRELRRPSSSVVPWQQGERAIGFFERPYSTASFRISTFSVVPNTWLALAPCRRATADTDAPGSSVSCTTTIDFFLCRAPTTAPRLTARHKTIPYFNRVLVSSGPRLSIAETIRKADGLTMIDHQKRSC